MSTQPKADNPATLDSAKKPAIILVHGFRGSPIGLEAIAKGLRSYGYEVFIPAVPPFGGAKIRAEASRAHTQRKFRPQKPIKYTPEDYADYLADYIKRKNLFRPILIGHSMGSIVVAAMLSRYPKLVNTKSVLLSPISNRAAAPFRVLSPLTAILPRRMTDLITTLYLFVPHDHNLLHQVLEITHDCSADQPPRPSEVLSVTAFTTRYSVADFRLPQRLLFLAGEKDRLVSKKQTLKLAKKVQAEMEFLPDCGHLHTYEKPQETVEKIINFLQN